MNEKILQLMNEIRAKRGLKLFKLHPGLIKAAQQHSDEMAKFNRFSHYGKNGSTWADRCRAAGYKSASLMNTGEDIGMGQTSEEMIIKDWCNSPGHFRPIIDPKHIHIGSGLATNKNGAKLWTTNFCSGEPDAEPEPDSGAFDQDFFNFI